jgi:hypothetical protein
MTRTSISVQAGEVTYNEFKAKNLEMEGENGTTKPCTDPKHSLDTESRREELTQNCRVRCIGGKEGKKIGMLPVRDVRHHQLINVLLDILPGLTIWQIRNKNNIQQPVDTGKRSEAQGRRTNEPTGASAGSAFLI